MAIFDSGRLVVRASKRAHLPSFLKDESWNRGVALKIEVCGDWFEETALFELRGDESAVQEILSHIKANGSVRPY